MRTLYPPNYSLKRLCPPRCAFRDAGVRRCTPAALALALALALDHLTNNKRKEHTPHCIDQGKPWHSTGYTHPTPTPHVSMVIGRSSTTGVRIGGSDRSEIWGRSGGLGSRRPLRLSLYSRKPLTTLRSSASPLSQPWPCQPVVS